MSIYLIRHGQDSDNAIGYLNGRRDNDLTELGVKQIEAAADSLRGKQISLILTSPLKRAVRTAQIIAQHLGINKIIFNNDLIERDFGIASGKPITEISQYATKVVVTPTNTYILEGPGVETFETVYQRAKNIFNTITTDYPNENILLVSHNDTGKMLQAVVNKQTWEQALQTPVLDNGEIVKLR